MNDIHSVSRIGVLAGRGLYPRLVCENAKLNGVGFLAVAAIRGDTDPVLSDIADDISWMYAGQLNSAIRYFKSRDVGHVIFAGQIKPSRLFRDLRPDLRAVKVLTGLNERNAESIFSAVVDEFHHDGITVLPATTYVEDSLADIGVLGRFGPKKSIRADIEIGRHIAFEVSRLNIGQTVVVKNGTILAVEGFEGTDKAILRGGELGHGGVVCVKVAKPEQDMRFDVPCIGLKTVESLVAADAKALAVEARKTLLLEKEHVVAALNKARIALVGIDSNRQLDSE